MADEVNVNIDISIDKDEVLHSYSPRAIAFDMAGNNVIDNTQIIGTSAENVFVGDAGALPLVVAENLDDTNYVELGYDNTGFVSVTKIPAGQVAVLRPTVTLQARANTANCNVRFFIIPQ